MTTAQEITTVAQEMARTFLDRDDLNGSWFELGGSSLDAARLVSSLGHDHGWDLALQDLLMASSVADVLRHPALPERPESPADEGTVRSAPAVTGGAEILWPALAQLSAADRLALAHRLLGDVLDETAEGR